MGIGNIYFGTYVDRIKGRDKLFSFIQLGICVSSFLLLLIIPQIKYLYKSVITGFNLNTAGSLPIIFFISLVLLLIPTFFMGGTFPVMTRLYIKRTEDIQTRIGILYGINTLGSVLGAGITGFFLIRGIGMKRTQVIAIIINFLISILILSYSEKDSREIKREYSRLEKVDFKDRLIKYLPLIAFLTGFASLACEILWIRALSIYLTNSTYTFTTILIIFLTGIFIGSIIFTKIYKKDLYGILSTVQILLGLYILGSCIFINRLPGILFGIQKFLEFPVIRIFLPPFALSIIAFLIPTILMGMSFPLICSMYSSDMERLGNRIGIINFLNTTGCALGTLASCFLLIHYFGIIRGLIITGFINLSIGTLFTILKKNKIFNYILICLSLILLLGIQRRFILPPSIYHTPGRADRVLYYKETMDGTVIVSEDRNTGIRSCYVNNSAVIGTTYDALKVVKLLGSLPFLLNPNAKEVLVIGYGVGITTSTIAKYDVERIDCVEICPGLRLASRYFSDYNDYVFSNSRVNFIANDGRNFLLLTEKIYDVISCDPTHPVLGSGNLYTKEYFLLCKKHLKEDGVLCQYLPFHKLSPDEFRSLIKTFAEVFPYVSLWLGYSHGILVGTLKPQIIDFDSIKKIRDIMLKDPYLIAVSILLDDEGIRSFAHSGLVNTDDRPLLEFFTPQSLKKENWELNITSVFSRRVDINRVIKGIDDIERIKKYLEGQRHFIKGLIYQNQGNQPKMLEEFKKVMEINPENQDIMLFLK